MDKNSQDFLHVHARTELCEHYAAAGCVFRLETNHAGMLASVRNTFAVAETCDHISFSLRFWVDEEDASGAPWPPPYVRGLIDRVYAGFDTKSSVLADLRARLMIGRFSPAMAADSLHWRTVVLPVLMSIMAGSLGLVELHASCVAKDGRGIVLLGPSRCGKSTLAMALLQSGFQLLSDDRVFCSLHGRQIVAHGLPRPLKLRYEASQWFQEVGRQDPTVAWNGERVLYWTPKNEGNSGRVTTCRPIALVFLQPQPVTGVRMIRMQSGEIGSRIEADLLAETPQAIANQQTLLNRLTLLPSWRLYYNASPKSTAQEILRIFEESGPLESERPLTEEEI